MERLRSKIDWLVYKWSWPFVTRYLKSTRGIAYLYLLQAQEWHEQNPMPDDLREATETFYNSMKEHKANAR